MDITTNMDNYTSLSFLPSQAHGDYCDDTLHVYAIRSGFKHQLNSLQNKINALIMVEDEHLQLLLTSCDRISLQTAHGFQGHVFYHGIFELN